MLRANHPAAVPRLFGIHIHGPLDLNGPKNGVTMNPLMVGSRVRCILYGGKDGVIYAIHGEQKPETVSCIASVITMGGNAEFDIVWEDGNESPRISEAIIHGVQWRVLPGTATAEEIATLRAFAATEQQRREKELAEQRERFAAEVESLKADPRYADLTQGHDECSGKLAAKNIRTELKRAFPDTKFSVRKWHHASVVVVWRDGPATKQVEAITNNYLAGSFNSSEDMYETAITPWNTVFGGSKYISCDRGYSVAVLQHAVQVVSSQRGFTPIPVESSESGDAYIAYSEDSRQVYDYLEMSGAYREPAQVENARDSVVAPNQPALADR